MASTLTSNSSSNSPSALRAPRVVSSKISQAQCRHQFTLQSPTKKSVFHFSTGSPIGKAELIQKITRTNMQQQTETTLYTIAVSRPIRPLSQAKSKVASKPPSTMDLLTAAALSELSKPGMQSPRIALRSVENLGQQINSKSKTSSQMRLKSVSPTRAAPITFKILPSKSSVPENPAPASTSIKRFSFVFQ